MSASHLLPANAQHVKNCTNHIAGSGNGAINSVGVGVSVGIGVGVGNRLPQGKYRAKTKTKLNCLRKKIELFQFHQRIT